MIRHPAFVEFEEQALMLVLGAFARAHGLRPQDLRPTQRVCRPVALERELETLGLQVDLRRLKTLRKLVGAAAPLLEARPRAHH